MSLNSRSALRRTVRSLSLALTLSNGLLACAPGVETSEDEDIEAIDQSLDGVVIGGRPFGARFAWAMDKRLDQAVQAYKSDRVFEYAHPDTFGVSFDACASSAGAGATYTWKFTGVSHPLSTTVTSSTCTTGSQSFPGQGSYDVQLTVRTAAGASSTVTERITLKDIVVLSLGDSLAAGEGNPDDPTGLADLQPWGDDPAWVNSICHRSMKSPHAVAARTLEDRDPHSSVTYVAFACTGAEIFNGMLNAEQDRIGRQVQNAITTMCDANSCRPVDYALISVGVNDVGFGSIMKHCVQPDFLSTDLHNACNALGEAENHFSDLRREFEALDGALFSRMHIDRVLLGEYPEDLAGGGGCGAMEDVNPDEAASIRAASNKLNGFVYSASVRHGYTFVEGIAQAFIGHGYCSPVPWFHSLTESLIDEHEYMGIFHPNLAGKEVIAQKIVAAMDSPAPPPRHTLDVTLKRAFISYDGSLGAVTGTGASAGIGTNLEAPLPVTGATNTWLTANLSRRFDVFGTLDVEAFGTFVTSTRERNPKTGVVSEETHEFGASKHDRYTAANNWGIGSHTTTVTDPDGATFTVEYAVAEPPPEQSFDVKLERVRIDYDGRYGDVLPPGASAGVFAGLGTQLPLTGAVNTWLTPSEPLIRRFKERESFAANAFGSLTASRATGVRDPRTGEPEFETHEVGLAASRQHLAANDFDVGKLETLTASNEGVTITVEYRVLRAPLDVTEVIGGIITHK